MQNNLFARFFVSKMWVEIILLGCFIVLLVVVVIIERQRNVAAVRKIDIPAQFMQQCNTTSCDSTAGLTCDPYSRLCLKVNSSKCTLGNECFSGVCSETCYDPTKQITSSSFTSGNSISFLGMGDLDTRCPCDENKSTCKLGTCKLNAGAGCTLDENCYSGMCDKLVTQTCFPQRDIGGTCSSDFGCTGGTGINTVICSRNFCQKKFIDTGSMGAGCNPAPCDRGLVCNINRICVTGIPMENACQGTVLCQQGYTCRPTIEGISFCQFDSILATCSGNCPDGTTCRNSRCTSFETDFGKNLRSMLYYPDTAGVKAITLYPTQPFDLTPVKKYRMTAAGAALWFQSNNLVFGMNDRIVTGVEALSYSYYIKHNGTNSDVFNIVNDQLVFTISGQVYDIFDTYFSGARFLYYVKYRALYGGKLPSTISLAENLALPLISTSMGVYMIYAAPLLNMMEVVYKDTSGSIRIADRNDDRVLYDAKGDFDKVNGFGILNKDFDWEILITDVVNREITKVRYDTQYTYTTSVKNHPYFGIMDIDITGTVRMLLTPSYAPYYPTG